MCRGHELGQALACSRLDRGEDEMLECNERGSGFPDTVGIVKGFGPLSDMPLA
jgi:hypothetical protein